MNADLHYFLSKFDKNYQQIIGSFWKYINTVSLSEGEYLSNNLGDVFFISSGYLGKYCQGSPDRYIGPGELVVIPLSSHLNHFKSLTDSKAYRIERKSLYLIIKKFPESLPLFEEIKEIHLHDLQFRYRLLKLPKRERLKYFKKSYPSIATIVSRKELADYLDVSTEYLRRFF